VGCAWKGTNMSSHRRQPRVFVGNWDWKSPLNLDPRRPNDLVIIWIMSRGNYLLGSLKKGRNLASNGTREFVIPKDPAGERQERHSR
jgi:hypothetical protein